MSSSSVSPEPVDPQRLDDLDVIGLFAEMTDPRSRRGVRHRLSTVLTIALAAVCAGARSFAAIGQWAQELAPEIAARLSISRIPETSTIRRVLCRLDADTFDALLGAWLWLRCHRRHGLTVISFDGKSARGARARGAQAAHLLAGLDQDTGVVVAQTGVDTKTNEIPCLRDLLKRLAIAGHLIVADALHTQRETAQLILDRQAHYLFTIKDNQPGMKKACQALPWRQVAAHRTTERHRGHTVTRSLKVVAAGGWLDFPGANQIGQLTRTVTAKDGKRTVETVYLICSLPCHQASPEQIADWTRGHWSIENKLHYVRDMAFDEDRQTAHTGSGPQAMASLRNLVISLLRLAGHTNITAALRHYSWHADHIPDLLLTSPERTLP
jgi:predicted transposase YbfD/YdcC